MADKKLCLHRELVREADEEMGVCSCQDCGQRMEWDDERLRWKPLDDGKRSRPMADDGGLAIDKTLLDEFALKLVEPSNLISQITVLVGSCDNPVVERMGHIEAARDAYAHAREMIVEKRRLEKCS